MFAIDSRAFVGLPTDKEVGTHPTHFFGSLMSTAQSNTRQPAATSA